MKVVHTRAEFATTQTDLNKPVNFVPTINTLHAGHATLLDTARRDCTSVVATIFVNPMQFKPSKNLNQYPRSLDTDVAVYKKTNVDAI